MLVEGKGAGVLVFELGPLCVRLGVLELWISLAPGLNWI